MDVMRGGLIAAILMLAGAPAVVEGQNREWRWRVVGDFGVFYATRDLGKAVGAITNLPNIQATASMDLAPFVGGGIEAMSVTRQLAFRLMARTTLGAKATGKLGVCNIATGDICVPREADAQVTLVSGEIAFHQGDPAQTLRPVLMGGVGVRRYSFTAESCPAGSGDDVVVCDMIASIFDDPRVTPFFQFGIGAEARRGPLSGYIRVQDVVGSYSGGASNVTGDIQNDVMGIMGATITIR